MTKIWLYIQLYTSIHYQNSKNNDSLSLPDEGVSQNVVLCYYNAVEMICLLVYERDSVNP